LTDRQSPSRKRFVVNPGNQTVKYPQAEDVASIDNPLRFPSKRIFLTAHAESI